MNGYDIAKFHKPLYYKQKLAYFLAKRSEGILVKLRNLQEIPGDLTVSRILSESGLSINHLPEGIHNPQQALNYVAAEIEETLKKSLRILVNDYDKFQAIDSMLVKYADNVSNPPSGLDDAGIAAWKARGEKAKLVRKELEMKTLLQEYFADTGISADIIPDPTQKQIRELLDHFPETARWRLKAVLRQERWAGIVRLLPRAIITRNLSTLINRVPYLRNARLVQVELTALLQSMSNRATYDLHFVNVVRIAGEEATALEKAIEASELNTGYDDNEFWLTFYRMADRKLWNQMKDAVEKDRNYDYILQEMNLVERVGSAMKRMPMAGYPPIWIDIAKVVAAGTSAGSAWAIHHYWPEILKWIGAQNILESGSRGIAEEKPFSYDDLFADGFPTEWDEYKVDMVLDDLTELLISN